MRGWASWIAIGSMLMGMGVAPVWASDDAAPAAGGDRMEETMTRFNLQPAVSKLGRGLANLLGGWLEIPYTIDQHYTASDTAGSMFTGAGHGIVRAVMRTGVGLYETVSFFIPYPENFEPILPTLPYFDKRNRTKRLPLE